MKRPIAGASISEEAVEYFVALFVDQNKQSEQWAFFLGNLRDNPALIKSDLQAKIFNPWAKAAKDAGKLTDIDLDYSAVAKQVYMVLLKRFGSLVKKPPLQTAG